MDPHMNKSLALCIVNSRESDLAQDDGAITHDGTPDLDQVFLQIEVDEVVITDTCSAGPHLGLVFVPVVPRLDDLSFEFFLDYIESFDCFRGRWVGSVEVDHFGSSCVG